MGWTQQLHRGRATATIACFGALTVGAFILSACSSDGGSADTAQHDDRTTSTTAEVTTTTVVDPAQLPIVFVHGFAGSAQQYETQAQRFAANGYPLDLISAFEHDGSGMDITAYAAGLDEAVDAALAEHRASQVYLVGHSRGTFVSSTYLEAPEQAAKVAKYIALDGRPCPDTPVPCAAIMKEDLPGQAHVEVATSPESFVKQYEFLLDRAPATTEVTASTDDVSIRGRAVNFPQNTGRDGVTLELWEIDPDSGQRLDDAPDYSEVLGADGAFGPITVSPSARYEYALSTPGNDVQHHLYLPPHTATSNFVRLLSSPPDGPTRANTNRGSDHVAVIALRMREWYAEGDHRDVLELGVSDATTDASGIDVIVPFVGNGAIGIHLHDDAATPGQSTLAALPYFSDQPFQIGVDIALAANPEASGTVTARNVARGVATSVQTFRFPNWPSDHHIVSLLFSDVP